MQPLHELEELTMWPAANLKLLGYKLVFSLER
jgi:hypothetical protein